MFTFVSGDVLGLISTISFRFCSYATWKQMLRPKMHRISPSKIWQLLLEIVEWFFLIVISTYTVEDGSAVYGGSENCKLTSWPVQFLESGDRPGVEQPSPQKEGDKTIFHLYTQNAVIQLWTRVLYCVSSAIYFRSLWAGVFYVFEDINTKKTWIWRSPILAIKLKTLLLHRRQYNK